MNYSSLKEEEKQQDGAAVFSSDDDDDDMMNFGVGSLMKDLLADLNVDEDDANNLLSLEQLENELRNLEASGGTAHPFEGAIPPSNNAMTSAAGMVVNSQAAYAQQLSPVPAATTHMEATSPMDAWSLSLQKFTASSLEADFLQADSARKAASAMTLPPPGLLDAAIDYDVTETATTMAPPPGMTNNSQQVISQAAAKLVQQLTTASSSEFALKLSQGLGRVSEIVNEDQQLQTDIGGLPPTLQHAVPPKPAPMTPQNSMAYSSSSNTETPTPAPTPVTTTTTGKPVNAMVAAATTGSTLPPPPVVVPVLAAPVVAVPLPQAWQQQQQRPTTVVMFANPHPSAPPIPATVLSSRFMTARDISYVVHGMLRPILAAETAGTMSTYHLEFWMRHHPVKPPPPATANKKGKDVITKEFASREKVAKQWSEMHKTLGSTAKTNVARPRALISTAAAAAAVSTTTSFVDENKQQQRAALWKSRIYCDQAYQALLSILHTNVNKSSSVLKLFKCLGVSVQTVFTDNDEDDNNKQASNTYSIDAGTLQLVLKLAKGKVLLARVLEQALLPPAAVEVVLPVALEILCSTVPSGSVAVDGDDVADDRVFGAAAVIIQTLPHLRGEVIVKMVRTVQHHSATALCTTARMQCTHALLQRGGAVAAMSQPSDFAEQWNTIEQEFLKILAGL